MTELERAIRDALRHQHSAVLDEIEDIIICALDYLAEEATAFGADERHDFRTDAAAADAIRKIATLIERGEANALRVVAASRGS